MHWVNSHIARTTQCGSGAILRGARRKKETVDIKIRKRTKSIREIEIEIMNETSEYLRLRREAMRGTPWILQEQGRSPIGLGARESTEAFLKEAFE